MPLCWYPFAWAGGEPSAPRPWLAQLSPASALPPPSYYLSPALLPAFQGGSLFSALLLLLLLLPSPSRSLGGGPGPGLVDGYSGGPGWAPEGLRGDCGRTAVGLRLELAYITKLSFTYLVFL